MSHINPAFSTDNVSYISLPGAWRHGGSPIGYLDDFLFKRTQNGGTSVLMLSRRRVVDITFRVTATELIVHANADYALNGAAIAFYYSPSGVGSADAFLVRKMSPYRPKELSPAKVSGSLTEIYDLDYNLVEEFV